MDNIEKNLYQFYHQIGMAKEVKYIHEKGYDVLISEKSFWPQIIFNLNQTIGTEKLIEKIAADISEKNYTPFFIAPEKFITRKHTAILKENRIIPVKILRGMNLISVKTNRSQLSPGFEIIEMNKQNHFTDFSNLVNSGLMASEMAFNPKLLDILKLGTEIKLFGLFNKQHLVSSTLVFTNNTNAGLYFIATKKEYQNKGYASILIQFIINKLFEGGIKEVVLHANNFAAGLYKKIGFAHQNNFVIYKKL